MKQLVKLIFFMLISGTAFSQEKKALDVAEFEKAISEENAAVIDVRRPEEFAKGHIQGAININWQNENEFAKKTASLDKSKPVYVYCLAGVRSEKASDWLRKHGFQHVYDLGGGIKAWKDAKRPTTVNK